MVMNLVQAMPNPVTESLMRWIQGQIDARREDYDVARRYYYGDHDTALTDRLKKFLPPRIAFRDNFCNVVVEALAERLKVTGISSSNENLAEWAWELWDANRMDYAQVVIHTDAVMVGDSYILCDWNEAEARPRWTHQKAELIESHGTPVSPRALKIPDGGF